MVYAADLKSAASACGFESRRGHRYGTIPNGWDGAVFRWYFNGLRHVNELCDSPQYPSISPKFPEKCGQKVGTDGHDVGYDRDVRGVAF